MPDRTPNPQHRPVKPRRIPAEKNRRRRAKSFIVMIACDVVKRTERQPSVQQAPVESVKSERQGFGLAPPLAAFDLSNALT